MNTYPMLDWPAVWAGAKDQAKVWRDLPYAERMRKISGLARVHYRNLDTQ